ncbi:hypothetical protein Tco_0444203, partial [Tanacetum coccineum]
IMPPKAMSKARMRELIREQVAASMAEFMANMNRGAGGDEAGEFYNKPAKDNKQLRHDLGNRDH